MRGHTNTKFKEKCSNSKTKVRYLGISFDFIFRILSVMWRYAE